MIQNPPAGDVGDTASILTLGKFPEEGMATHSRILAWRIHGSGFLGSSVIQNPPAGDVGDTASILRLGKSPGEGMATHSRILAWRIPWTEEPGGLESIGWRESDMP